MNERIRQLAEQVMNSDISPHLSTELYCFTKSEFEKFTDLMIRECTITLQDFIDHRIPASEYPSRLKKCFDIK